jgi:S-adenosylmethionine-diacylglycerol 3-amino-3-carboxypropyl transferase
MRSEAATRAAFSRIRHAQVWEDADILLEGLDIQPGHICVSIASAGGNALAGRPAEETSNAQ